MNLNIIGNGFDLYHGLPSSYYYYGCYLITTNPIFFEEIYKMHNSKFGKGIGSPISHKYIHTVDDILWTEFEKIIGEVKETFIVETYEDDLGLENNDPIDLNMEKELIANEIRKSFENWIKEMVDRESNYKIINGLIYNSEEKCKFDNRDYFIIFNYTHTLQNLYNISEEKVTYVHGECI